MFVPGGLSGRRGERNAYFVHRERLANKDKEQGSDVTIEYNDGELEERRRIRRQRNLSENWKKIARFF